MWVNFASGVHPFPPPWRNVDRTWDPTGCQDTVDLLDDLPAWMTGIEWAYVGHFLEHLTKAECAQFLTRVHDRMAAGGRIVVVGPDADRARRWYEHQMVPAQLLARVRRHGQPEGHNRADCHLWDCTGPQVVALLKGAGWVEAAEFPIAELCVRYPPVPMIDPAGWQFTATAVSPVPAVPAAPEAPQSPLPTGHAAQ